MVKSLIPPDSSHGANHTIMNFAGEKQLRIMEMNFFKRVSKFKYFHVDIKEDGLMLFLEKELKKINPQLSLETTLSELSEIDQWKAKLRKDTNLRFQIAPSKSASISRQIDDIKSYIEFNDKDNNKADNANPGYYLNEYRKIAYNHLAIGDDLTLRQMGYLLLNEHWKRLGNEEVFHCVTITSSEGLKFKLNAIAEGAAFAYHLPYLENLLSKIAMTKNNPWLSGTFYLFMAIMVIASLAVISNKVNWTILPMIIVGGNLLIGVIGALQLKNDDKLKDESFIKLMTETLKKLTIISRRK